MAGTVVVTGANGSLGLGFVKNFIFSYPDHTLIATVRNTSNSDPNTAKLHNLISQHPKAKDKVILERLDLGSLDEVRSFTTRVAARVASGELPRIDAIVCNASSWSLRGQKFTVDGREAAFQVCHLSQYLLVLRLLEAVNSTSGRIVMLGSEAHYTEKDNVIAGLRAKVPEDLDTIVKPTLDEPGQEHDRGFQRYGTAKLANVMFMHDLNQRLQAVCTLQPRYLKRP